MVYTEYTWVFVIAIICAFFAAFGIGANDIANSFSTSVGSGSISLKNAILLACVFEFCGAFFMGGHVTKTIRKGIADIDLFEDDPDILMFGMMCVCVSTACWLILATFLNLPISTTHTVVGSIMGFTIAFIGFEGVQWSVIIKIVTSWFLSPVLSGVGAVLIQTLIVHGVMKREDPVKNALLGYPLLVFFTFCVLLFYTIYKGTKIDISIELALGITLGLAVFAAIIAKFCVVPNLVEQMNSLFSENKDVEMQETHTEQTEDVSNAGVEKKTVDDEFSVSKDDIIYKKKSFFGDLQKEHESTASPELLKMLENSVVYDKKAEHVFTHLQVITACFAAFAHGANDVANAIGPLAAVAAVYDTREVDKKSEVPAWISLLGALGIVFGLVIYGYNILKLMSFQLTKITPSRGFAIQLGASCVIITGSRLELPLSTTHCLVGATIGLGLMEGCNNVNWNIIPRVIGGWLITLVVAALGTGLLFSFAVFSPRA